MSLLSQFQETEDKISKALNHTTRIIEHIPHIELQYIQSSGTQYIDTGYKHDLSATRMVADIEVLAQPSSWRDILGSWGGERSTQRMFGIEINNTAATSATTFYGQNGSDIGSVLGRKTYDLNKNVHIIGSVTKTFSALSTVSLYNDYIFSNSGYNGTGKAGAIMRLYYFKIYHNGILVRDFIPVRKIDGTVCLYEKVSKSYYLNAGSGSFIAGPEII